MILVFILFGIIILMLLVLMVFILSTISIDVKKLIISNNKEKQSEVQNKKLKLDELLDYDYVVNISLKFLGKIKIFNFKLDKNSFKKLDEKMNIIRKIKSIDVKSIKDNVKLDKDLIKDIGKLKVKIKKFNLKIDIGTEDVILTAGLVFLVSTFISVLFPRIIGKFHKEDHKYIIAPYYNKNIFKLDLNSVINVKIINVICMLYIYSRKRRANIDRQVSNRNPYDLGYEQY